MVANEYEIEIRVRDLQIEAQRLQLGNQARRLRGQRLATAGPRFHLAGWVSRRLLRVEPCGQAATGESS